MTVHKLEANSILITYTQELTMDEDMTLKVELVMRSENVPNKRVKQVIDDKRKKELDLAP